jgi:hypothetical protein
LRKESRETVEEWIRRSGAAKLANVTFVPPQEYLSSYELIQQAKFVMVYNSTIGLEASILGVPVLCAGKARFTQYPTVFFPQNPEEHLARMREFLGATTIEVPSIFRRNARDFSTNSSEPPLHRRLPGSSVRKTQARLKPFEHQDLTRLIASIRAIWMVCSRRGLSASRILMTEGAERGSKQSLRGLTFRAESCCRQSVP